MCDVSLGVAASYFLLPLLHVCRSLLFTSHTGKYYINWWHSWDRVVRCLVFYIDTHMYNSHIAGHDFRSVTFSFDPQCLSASTTMKNVFKHWHSVVCFWTACLNLMCCCFIVCSKRVHPWFPYVSAELSEHEILLLFTGFIFWNLLRQDPRPFGR